MTTGTQPVFATRRVLVPAKATSGPFTGISKTAAFWISVAPNEQDAGNRADHRQELTFNSWPLLVSKNGGYELE